MPTFSKRDLTIDQIAGGSVLAASLLMGIIGAICLKHKIGLPEYIIGLRNTGWTLALLASIWTALATWRQLTR